jgi:hypothetical protein
MKTNNPSWCMFAKQAVVVAASRALFKEGSRMEINNAMIPITTNSSTNVKPGLTLFRRMSAPRKDDDMF